MTSFVESTVDFAPGLETAFFRECPERIERIRNVEGTLPTYLRGSYYMNGPARFHFDGDFRYRHWLDGDGMVCCLRFGEDQIDFCSRYVQGRKWLREQTSEPRPTFRTFGTAFPGDRLKRGLGTESPFNVSVFPYKDRLLAFGEQSLPMELDPVTLETRTPGETFDFDQSVNDAAPFSAHPKIDPHTGELMNFGVFFAPDHPLLTYYRFDADGKLACRSRIAIDYPCSLHDFAVSQRYAIFYLSPYLLDTSGLTDRGLATIDSLSWRPDHGSQLVVLCRETGDKIANLHIGSQYSLHTINAFEHENQLIVDVVHFERPVYDQYQVLPNLFEDVPSGRPIRLKINLEARVIVGYEAIEYSHAPDFPTIDPHLQSQPYDDFWMLGISATGQRGRKFFDRLVHANWTRPDAADVWACPRCQYLGSEPAFVRDPTGETDGVVICHLFDAVGPSSSFAIFDAGDVSAGPIAKVPLEAPIHLGFHASFRSD